MTFGEMSEMMKRWRKASFGSVRMAAKKRVGIDEDGEGFEVGRGSEEGVHGDLVEGDRYGVESL